MLNPLDHPICLATPRRIAPSTWMTHVPFGMLLMDLLRPSILVELGTFWGVSYCAFCQAVYELGLDTRCYAIDTWEGDVHVGAYGHEVLVDLRAHHDPLYGRFSRLVPSNFVDAARAFSDGSVDLLHIDGSHSYDAVRADFDTWSPKLSQSGVALFHDINVREKGFGVWQLWEDLASKYPHFAMNHGHGLGVLAIGSRGENALAPLLKLSDAEQHLVQELFRELGERSTTLWELNELRREAVLRKTDIDWLNSQLDEFRMLQKNIIVRFVRAWHHGGVRHVATKVVERASGPAGKLSDG